MTSTGEPRRRKGNYAGAAVHDARTPTIKSMPACRLAIEVGGRWSHEATQFLSLLAHKKARDAPPAPRPCFTTALLARLTAIHTHPCGHARLCVVLLSLPAGDYPNPEALPPNGQLLAHYPESSTNPSRLPPIMDVAFPSWSGPQRSWATWRDLREKGRKKKDFAGLFCGHWPKNLVHAVPQCVQPFPIAVSTRAGTEAAARSKKRNLSALTEANPTSTPFWLLTAFEPMTAPPEAACCQGWVRGSLRAVASHVFGCGTHDI